MGDVQESRRKKLELLRSARQETWKELAKALGLSTSSFLSQLMSGEREFTEKTARKYEKKLSLKLGYFDEDPTENSGTVTHIDMEIVADAAVRVIRLSAQDRRAKLSDAQLRKIVGMAVVQASRDGGVNEEYIKQLLALAGSG